MMIEAFILRALLGGIGVALMAGVLGCFIVWRRMAYFGDSLSHSALLGVALGLLYGLNVNISTALVCAAFALLLVSLQQKRIFATDTLLGILAHASLSLGMLAVHFLNNPNFDLHAYLFGDVLAIQKEDLYWIYGGGALVFFLLCTNWQKLVLMTIHEDIARAEGINTFQMQALLMLMTTIVVAVSIHIIGILLVTSLLIIPAATARQLARSPAMMAVYAALLGLIAIVGGIALSAVYDAPSGPSIVALATGLFVFLFIAKYFIFYRKNRGI